MKIAEIEKMVESGVLYEHHTSYARGYVSRKMKWSELEGEEYKGKFGEGFKVYSPNFNSTNYCYVTYYIYK